MVYVNKAFNYAAQKILSYKLVYLLIPNVQFKILKFKIMTLLQPQMFMSLKLKLETLLKFGFRDQSLYIRLVNLCYKKEKLCALIILNVFY